KVNHSGFNYLSPSRYSRLKTTYDEEYLYNRSLICVYSCPGAGRQRGAPQCPTAKQRPTAREPSGFDKAFSPTRGSQGLARRGKGTLYQDRYFEKRDRSDQCGAGPAFFAEPAPLRGDQFGCREWRRLYRHLYPRDGRFADQHDVERHSL